MSDPLGLKLLTYLRLNFSHLSQNKFSHNLRDTVKPMCFCGAGVEATDHHLLHLQNYKNDGSLHLTFTAQRMKISIKDFCSKCDQIRRNP